MSYLNLPEGIPDFSKAVISFWFRVPRTSLEACAEKADVEFKADEALRQTAGYPSGYVFSRMHTIVPLMTFGPMFEGYQIKTVNGTPITYNQSYGGYNQFTGYGPIYLTNIQYTTDGPRYNAFSKVLSNPSFIGVRSTWVYDNDGNSTGQLDTSVMVRIQMKDLGSGSWVTTRSEYSFGNSVTLSFGGTYAGVQTDVAWSYSFDSCMKDGIYPNGTFITNVTLRDETAISAEQFGPQESFEGFYVIEDNAGNGITIAPDKWHHFLISFDLSHSMTGKGAKFVFDQPDCSVGSGLPPRSTIEANDTHKIEDPCKMWMALNDVNNEAGIDQNYDSVGMGINDITTYNCKQAALAINTGQIHFKVWDVSGLVHIGYNDVGYGQPTWSYSPGLIPSKGYALAIPCTPELVDSIYRVEMAEFQMWTGVTLDTGIIKNRRAFVDKEGEPVDPIGTIDDPAPAEELLRKKPDVLLHGSDNWKEGYNTGTLGIRIETDADGNKKVIKIPEGQFTRTGGIEKYKPDPALEESTA